MKFWWVFLGFQWDLMWSRGFYGIIDIFFVFDGILVGVTLDLLGFDCFLNGNLIGYNYVTWLILMEYWFVASGVLSCGCMGKSSKYMGNFPASHVRLPEGEATTNPKTYKTGPSLFYTYPLVN
jgi:hypothetical protein